MYRFYCDDTLFFKSDVDDEEYYLIDSKLTLEKGKTSSLSFTLPFSNIVYNRINKLKSIITVYDDDEEIFRGRVLYDEKDFYNRKTITCEGDLAFLLDSVVRPYEHKGSIDDFFTTLIENHNSQVDEKKKFNIGDITVKDNNDYINRSSIDYENTYNVITKKLIETHGGFLKTRVVDGIRYIDYLEDYGETNEQVIEFGVNLLDIKEFITAEDIFTCLIPLGSKKEDTDERLTIESVNGGLDYLENNNAIELFGRIWATNTWDDVTIASNLKTKAQAYLDSNVEMSVTLTLKAIDLHLMNVNTDRIKEGDKLRVVSLPHNIDKYFECTKIDINPLNPSNNEYTFGSTYKTLTDPSTKVDSVTATYVEEAITKVEETTQKEIADVHDKLTQEEIMNIITKNGEVEGVYLLNGQIWINGTYIKADTLSAINSNLGNIKGGSININDLFIVDDLGKLKATYGNVAGFSLSDNGFTKTTELTLKKVYTNDDLTRLNAIMSKSITPTEEDYDYYDVNEDGKISALDYVLINNYLIPLNDDKLYTDVIINPLNLSLKDINNENSNPAIIVRYRKSNGEVLYQTSISANRLFTNNIFCRNIEVENGIISKNEIQIHDKTGESDSDEGGLIFAELFNNTVNLNLLCNSGGYLALGTKGNRWYMQDIANDDDWKSAFFSRDTGSALGKSGNPWYRLYAEKSTSVTSDKRVKCDFKNFDDRYIKFVECLTPTLYHRVGEENNPLESGFIAQEVEKAMEEVGINKSELDIVEHDVENDRYSLHYEQFIPILFYYIQTKNKDYEERLKNIENFIKEVKK